MNEIRLIDANALKEIIDDEVCDVCEMWNDWESYHGFSRDKLAEMISSVPTVDAVPVVHGKWIQEPYEPYKCSVCGRYEIDNDEPYCHCGAKMDE